MSPAVPSSSDDVEIDLGRWAHRVVARWYIVLACVIVADRDRDRSARAAGHQVWTARALVNQGQPYTSTNEPIAASLGTNPSAAATLLKQDIVVKFVAAKVGLQAGPAEGRDLDAARRPPQRRRRTTRRSSRDRARALEDEGRARREPARAAAPSRSRARYQRRASPRCTTAGRTQEAAARRRSRTRDKRRSTTTRADQVDGGLSPFEKALALNSAIGLLNSIETRQQQLQDAAHRRTSRRSSQIQDIEMPAIVTRGDARRRRPPRRSAPATPSRSCSG